MAKTSRSVRIVLCSEGTVLGTLPPFDLDDPWWAEVEPLVASARARFAIEIVVLRLLRGVGESGRGGRTTYLAELIGDPPPDLPLEEIEQAVGQEEPLRASWARPGGVRAAIAWADVSLAAIGRPRTGPAVQIKTWNLSSILRLPTSAGWVWLKSVPPFMAPEGILLGLIGNDDPSLVPHLVAADGAGRTVLLDDVSGADQWDPAETILVRMVQDLVVLQARWADRVDELISAGLPDWRAAAFPDLVRRVLFRPEVLAQLNEADRARLEPLVAGLAERFDSLAACSLPDTLVHGDFHPGNWRGDGPTLILLDWGDAGVGHPLLDLSAFEATLAHDVRESVRREWFAAWRTARPQCDPARAAELIGPIASLRQALVYQNFLDGIEPDERHYHRADVPAWLHRAVSEPAQPRS